MKNVMIKAALVIVLMMSISSVGLASGRAELPFEIANAYIALIGEIKTYDGQNVEEDDFALTLTSSKGIDALLVVETWAEIRQDLHWDLHQRASGYYIPLFWRDCLRCKQKQESITLEFTGRRTGTFIYENWIGSKATGTFMISVGIHS